MWKIFSENFARSFMLLLSEETIFNKYFEIFCAFQAKHPSVSPAISELFVASDYLLPLIALGY